MCIRDRFADGGCCKSPPKPKTNNTFFLHKTLHFSFTNWTQILPPKSHPLFPTNRSHFFWKFEFFSWPILESKCGPQMWDIFGAQNRYRPYIRCIWAAQKTGSVCGRKKGNRFWTGSYGKLETFLRIFGKKFREKLKKKRTLRAPRTFQKIRKLSVSFPEKCFPNLGPRRQQNFAVSTT